MDAQYRPVSLLGEGRAWCALTDGTVVEQGAREAFGRLAYWTTQQRMEKPVDEQEQEQDPRSFTRWWANKVHTELFGDRSVRGAADLEDITPLHERLLNDPDLNVRLDRFEEASVHRIATT